MPFFATLTTATFKACNSVGGSSLLLFSIDDWRSGSNQQNYQLRSSGSNRRKSLNNKIMQRHVSYKKNNYIINYQQLVSKHFGDGILLMLRVTRREFVEGMGLVFSCSDILFFYTHFSSKFVCTYFQILYKCILIFYIFFLETYFQHFINVFQQIFKNNCCGNVQTKKNNSVIQIEKSFFCNEKCTAKTIIIKTRICYLLLNSI